MFESGETTKGSRAYYAAKALKEAGSYSGAAELLKKWSEADPEIWRVITQPFLDRACSEAARESGRHQRTSWRAPKPTPTPEPDLTGRGERLREFAKRQHLDFPLLRGKPLRDARAADLKETIDFYTKQANDMHHKAAWLTAILARVGKKKVGSVWTEEELEKLKQKIIGE